jgi:O-antigen/teichoic acid export membrane protein
MQGLPLFSIVPGFSRLVSRVQQALGLLRLRPFDTTSPEGRSRERLRRAALTTVTAAVARAIGMATPLITIPLTLGYLGHELYGLWMVVTSLVGMFAFADLGLGNGLVTALSRANGKGDQDAARRLVSTTTFLLLGMALLLGLALGVAWPFLPWPALVNAQNHTAAAAAGGVVAAYTFCFLLNLPLATIQRTQMALQEGFQSNLWQCGASILGLLAVVIAVEARMSPPLFVLAVTASPMAVTLANWWWFFHYVQPGLRPRWANWSPAHALSLFRTGLGFFLLSILTSIGLYADNVIIAHLSGLESVAMYSVAARAIMIVGAVMSMICVPMWAANGEALARGDIAWVRRNTARLVKLSIGFTTLAAVLMISLGPLVLRVWLGSGFEVSRLLLGALALFAIGTSASAPFFMVLNAAGVVYPQVMLFLIFTPVALVAKIELGRIFGPVGVAAAGGLCYGMIVVPAVVLLARRVYRHSEPAL